MRGSDSGRGSDDGAERRGIFWLLRSSEGVRPGWRERFPDTTTCVRCLEEKPTDELDRLLWCPECRRAAHRCARRWGRLAGIVSAALLAGWIWLVIQPLDSMLGAWLAVVAAAYYLISRIGREIAFGVVRVRNRRAAEARPP